jgi:hypothetical protein
MNEPEAKPALPPGRSWRDIRHVTARSAATDSGLDEGDRD